MTVGVLLTVVVYDEVEDELVVQGPGIVVVVHDPIILVPGMWTIPIDVVIGKPLGGKMVVSVYSVEVSGLAQVVVSTDKDGL